VPILPAQGPTCRTRLPIEVESLAEEYNAERSANR
jgi:hypothetical protein